MGYAKSGTRTRNHLEAQGVIFDSSQIKKVFPFDQLSGSFHPSMAYDQQNRRPGVWSTSLLLWSIYRFSSKASSKISRVLNLSRLVYQHGAGNNSVITVFIGAEWQPGHRQYCLEKPISTFLTIAPYSKPVSIIRLTLIVPGKLLELPSNSTHLTSASFVAGARCSRISCSIHWLEFITSKHAYSPLGHPSWTVWAFTLVRTNSIVEKWISKRIVGEFDALVEGGLGNWSVTMNQSTMLCDSYTTLSSFLN